MKSSISPPARAAARLDQSLVHASHVIIRGHVFTYEEKAPFVQSKVSLLGALEFDPKTDRTKCHECGEWQRQLSWHVMKQHSMTTDLYRSEHGLRPNTGLSGMARRNKARANAERHRIEGRGIAAVMRGRTTRLESNRLAFKHSVEVQNSSGKCATQLLFKVLMCAANVGHTPTGDELAAIGVTKIVLPCEYVL
jgi:predicted transcriptional regulator